MKSKLFIPSMLFTLSILYAFTIPHTFAIEPTIEKAVLKGNWEEVVNALEKDDSKANDPAARLIMAHASLATNRNNAAMMLFLSVREESDVTSWTDWTSSLLNKNPENPVALYLRADAQARSGNFGEAVQLLTKATNLPSSPLSQNSTAGEIDNSEMVNYALICNARGVLRMLTNDMDYALMDILQATRLAPNLADAHANLGSYYIMTEAADGALEEFRKAIEINPEFALAYNGLGCAYFGSGRFEAAAQSFSMASQLCPILAIAEINQGFTSAYSSKLITVAEKITENPGTTFTSISKQYPEILKEQNQQLLKTLPSQSDHEFWGKINNVSSLSDSQYQSLVKEYGAQKVQIGTFLKMQELKGKLVENYQTKLSVPEKTDFANRVLPNALSSSDFTGSSQKSWKPFFTSSSGVSDKGNVISRILNSHSSPESKSNKQVTVVVTDFGINHWKPELEMFDDFSKAKAGSVIPNLPKQGQILVPMPADKDYPKSQAQKDLLKSTISNGIIQKIRDGNLQNYEIRIVQNINTAGYFDPLGNLPGIEGRQERVKDFGLIVYEALDTAKNRLSNAGTKVYMPAIVGSNGGYLFTETIPKLQRNPVDKGIVVDPRAYVNSFKETYKLMPGNLIGINTAGDAPALPDMMANHDAMKNFKKETPDFRLFFVDTTKGSIPNDIFISKHLASMNPKNAPSPLFIKEFDGKGYTTQTESTGWGFMSKLAGLEQPLPSTFSSYKGRTIDTALDAAKLRAVEFKLSSLSGNFASPLPRQPSSPIPGYFTATDRPITEVGALASMVDKGIKSSGSARSALIVSQDTFRTNLLQSELSKYGFQTKVIPPGTDPQTAARQWGADVILGVKGTPEMKFPQKTSIPLGNSLQKYSGNDNYRKVQPLLPPDNGGGGGGIVNQNWNWGKQFTPSYQKGDLPGGVSTEEIAKAFVDKGNWPVLTTFGLFYK